MKTQYVIPLLASLVIAFGSYQAQAIVRPLDVRDTLLIRGGETAETCLKKKEMDCPKGTGRCDQFACTRKNKKSPIICPHGGKSQKISAKVYPSVAPAKKGSATSTGSTFPCITATVCSATGCALNQDQTDLVCQTTGNPYNPEGTSVVQQKLNDDACPPKAKTGTGTTGTSNQ
jgi:hypothetical protein